MNNKVNKISGLTEQEEEICKGIGKICSLFNKLPLQHPSDIGEWNYGIHLLQGLLMQRIARRAYPKYWRNDEKDKI